MHLKLENIHKSYGDRIIFDQLSFLCNSSGFYLLSGKSGSGKTTLLNILSGYEKFDAGTREIDCKIACIFQNYELIEELTVLENIQISSDIHNRKVNHSLLELLKLDELKDRYPNELSMGQKQRVGIARAINQYPDAIIVDEPTESLDIDNKRIVLDFLKEYSKDKIVIVSSHEVELCKEYYDYHYILEDHNITLSDSKVTSNSTFSQTKDEPYSITKLISYIFRIIYKRTLLFIILICSLIGCQSYLTFYKQQLFSKDNNMKCYQPNMISVDLFNEKQNVITSYQSLKLLEFDPININGRNYKIGIYPDMSNKVKSNHIIINKRLANLLGKEELVGKDISLSYKLLNDTTYFELEIIEIVDEADNPYPAIYYSYEYIMDCLKQTEGNESFSNEYEYLLEFGTSYYIKSEDVEKDYEQLSKNQSILVAHPVLDQRKQVEKQQDIYKLLFNIIEYIVIGIIIILIVFFNLKDTKYNKTPLSLIYSFYVPLPMIKASYLFIKMILYLLFMICVYFIIRYFRLSSMLLGIYTTVYLISLSYTIFRYSTSNISMILKENKD